MNSVTPEQLKHMADKTVEPFLDKLKQNPNDPDLLHQVGNAYYAAHQFGTAVEYYSKSADLKPDPMVLTQLSNAYHYSGSDEKAIATLDRALQVDPTFANALFNLGMLKWQTQGDSAAAIKAWEKLLKTNPKHPNRSKVEQLIARVKEQTR
jgi:cytochrome c-type biogenesis protein CcmH/NrfG